MFRKISAIAAVLVTGLIATPTTALATPSALGNWYVLTWEDYPRLIQVDKTTGVGTLIGTSTLSLSDGMAGFDVDATAGVGRFISYEDETSAHLYTVNLTNGQITQGPATAVRHVTAFDLGNNGEIWIAADQLDSHQNAFAKVNKDTGVVTYLADCPDRISALATSPAGVLYAISYSRTLYRVNTSTYVFTEVGTTPNSIMASDFDTNGKLISMDWDGAISSIDTSSFASTDLFTVNISPAVQSEAFAVGGPTNGQTLTQALNGGGSELANTGTDDLRNVGLGLLLTVSGLFAVTYSRRTQKN